MQRPNRIDRRALFWLARRMFAGRTGDAPEDRSPRRVLVVRVDERVGNLVSLQSLLDALGQGLDGSRLGLLVSTRAGRIADSLEGVEWVHRLDKRWFYKRPTAWHRVISEVRGVGYQVALDASAWHEFSFTHAALTYFSGAPVRIGYDRGGGAGFHTHLVRPGPADEYELAQRMRLLGPLGIEMAPPPLWSSLGESQAPRWEDWLRDQRADRPRVGIWPGSRKLERRWKLAYYARLAKRLLEHKAGSLVILWGPGEERLRDELTAAIPSDRVTAPPTDILELAGLMRRLDLLVTNDTGPMHLAVALGVPTVALFASGDPRRWGHPYPKVRNLRTPGLDEAEIDQALDGCLGLLDGIS